MLLHQMGFSFHVLPSRISEKLPNDLPIPEGLKILSLKKAEAVLSRVPDGLVIGADTVVVLDNAILGKPRTEEEAVLMLSKLSGRTHSVFTGFALVHVGGEMYTDVERTDVTFRVLQDWEIEDYVSSGGPLDKAGGYGIQDRSGFFVESINGCFYNVVGFPLTKFYQGLGKLYGKEFLRTLLQAREHIP